MTREKAIEILKLAISDPDLVGAVDLMDAQNLGIEALKRCQLARKETSFVGPGLLPGETES
ncbi:unnamed protein product [marine sediment metagenome]|uniref:B12-binding N-terminal domain-containing protein n=2 Tax=marine sediment metagenome TaxID=412755 RepID=X1S1Y2_9ZZZZ